MQNLFSLKWLSFYGTTIAIVIALFSVTTQYGETRLKAPPKIAGRYQIDAKTLPGCLQNKTLVLTIEQSGIYLSGSILETDASMRTETAAKKKPALMGLWSETGISLSGLPDPLQACELQNTTVEIRGRVEQEVLQGEMKLGSARSQFIAQREPTSEQRDKH